MTVLAIMDNGRLRAQDENGRITEIGPEHPDYQRLAATYRPSPRQILQSRLAAGVFILVGVGASWFVWHQLVTEGSYSLRLSLVGPATIPFGLLMMFRPEWGGPWREDTPGAQKAGVVVTLAISLVLFIINYYLMQNYRP